MSPMTTPSTMNGALTKLFVAPISLIIFISSLLTVIPIVIVLFIRNTDTKRSINMIPKDAYPTNAFIGINASGKTSMLKVILLALDIVNNEPINHIKTRDILGNTKNAVLNIFFYSELAKEICRLETTITSETTKTEGSVYRIVSEKLWSKQTDEVTTRKTLLDFEGKEPVMVRSGKEDFLSDDVSIMIARNKKTGESTRVVNLLLFTNINVLPFSEDIPAEVITFLDPTIESLHFVPEDKKTVIYLKFKGKEEIVLNNPIELNNYLSSGDRKSTRLNSSH